MTVYLLPPPPRACHQWLGLEILICCWRIQGMFNMPGDNTSIDTSAITEALLNLSEEDKAEFRHTLKYILTEERWKEIHKVIRAAVDRREQFSLRDVLPNITEEEEQLFNFLGQFFVIKQ